MYKYLEEFFGINKYLDSLDKKNEKKKVEPDCQDAFIGDNDYNSKFSIARKMIGGNYKDMILDIKKKGESYFNSVKKLDKNIMRCELGKVSFFLVNVCESRKFCDLKGNIKISHSEDIGNHELVFWVRIYDNSKWKVSHFGIEG